MRALSLDLRERIIRSLRENPSSLVVAARFHVSASCVRKLRLRQQRTGSIEPDRAPGRARLVADDAEARLRNLVAEYPDATLKVLAELLADATGVAVSETTMWRQLRRMGFSMKKERSTRRSASVRT